jgi:hypothetical protein
MLCASSASASFINLSTHSSDHTAPSRLSATLDFEVFDSMLTLTVSNDTADPWEYTINRLFFNVDPESDVTGLELTGAPDGWTLVTDKKAGGFGYFDFALIGGVGNDPWNILPGEREVFTFTILGSASVSDFLRATSTEGFVAAAKFIRGPGDDSAFGAAIPAPGAIVLLAAGWCRGQRLRRRQGSRHAASR